MIKVELKKVNLTKSIINQLPLITFPPTLNFEVLGWVSLNEGKVRYSIVKIAGEYKKTHVIKEIDIVPEQTYDNEYKITKSMRIIRWDKSVVPLTVQHYEEHNLLVKQIVEKLVAETKNKGQIFY